jgi:ribosome maturation factor RimP
MGPPIAIHEEVMDYLAPILYKMGFFLLAVELTGYKSKRLAMYIEGLQSPIVIDQLSFLARYIRNSLEVEFPDSGNWELEVSSPGLSRELKTERERGFYKGRDIRIVFKNGKIAIAKLIDGDEETITYEDKSGRHSKELDLISRINLHDSIEED